MIRLKAEGGIGDYFKFENLYSYWMELAKTNKKVNWYWREIENERNCNILELQCSLPFSHDFLSK